MLRRRYPYPKRRTSFKRFVPPLALLRLNTGYLMTNLTLGYDLIVLPWLTLEVGSGFCAVLVLCELASQNFFRDLSQD